MTETEFNFEEALKAQLEATEAEPPETEADPDEGEPAPEPEPVADEPDEPEEPAEEPEQQEPADVPTYAPEVQAYLERFKGDTEAALRSAVEAQSLIGRQGTELGELRKAVEELQQTQRVQRETPQDLDEQIEENPAQVAQWALQNGQTGIYEAAMGAWYEQNPRDAGRFERALELELQRQQLLGELQPTVQSAQQQQALAEFTQAQKELRAKYQDFDELLSTATEQDLQGFPPHIATQIQGQGDKKAGLELLYRWVRAGRDAQQAAEQAERTEHAKTAKKEAVVATSTSTQAREEKDMMQLLEEQMLAPPSYSVTHGLQRD